MRKRQLEIIIMLGISIMIIFIYVFFLIHSKVEQGATLHPTKTSLLSVQVWQVP